MPLKHGPIEACNSRVRSWLEGLFSMPLKHGPIEAHPCFGDSTFNRKFSMPLKHGPIEACSCKRRREVEYTATLCERTESTARGLYELIDTGILRRHPSLHCRDECSPLVDVCLPLVLVITNSVSDYVRSLWMVSSETGRDFDMGFQHHVFV